MCALLTALWQSRERYQILCIGLMEL